MTPSKTTVSARIAALTVVACIAMATSPGSAIVQAADWTQFRGPSGNGVVQRLTHPANWNSDSNLAWSQEIGGGGWSSPIVIADRVIVTTAVSSGASQAKGFSDGVASMRSRRRAKVPNDPVSFEVACFDLARGTELWRRVVDTKKPPYGIHPSNTFATETPTTDGNHVFVYFAAIGVVACFDLDGQQIWKQDVGAYPTSNNFGTGSSLAQHGGKLFVQCDNQQSSFLLALDAATGETAWRVDRRSRTCWSTPIVWENDERTELVVCGSGYVTAYDPRTGSELWKLTGVGGSFSASPAFDRERIYFGNSGPGSRGPLVAVSAGAGGSLTLDAKPNAHGGVAWTQASSGPGMASPVAHDGRVYVAGRGILTCHDAKTGERVYRQRLQGAANISASLWIAENKLFVLDESGNTFVIKAGDEFELLDTNTIAGLYWSTPAVAHNALLLRDATKLHCIRGDEKSVAVITN